MLYQILPFASFGKSLGVSIDRLLTGSHLIEKTSPLEKKVRMMGSMRKRRNRIENKS
ncbi:hypothetical protein SPSIL_048770 [Sporomusa silvacetica DSM 10669]|uniref:Uncharacterized protein n=1 Tax=Sporomusa silvacetica DSM 10669 TaxID=1123289 RepID=A0ABZ3ITC9_9FIRM|nr:hypothetical protein SPSIL_47970 [Sporomusa silvacetica DSM 10669]